MAHGGGINKGDWWEGTGRAGAVTEIRDVFDTWVDEVEGRRLEAVDTWDHWLEAEWHMGVELIREIGGRARDVPGAVTEMRDAVDTSASSGQAGGMKCWGGRRLEAVDTWDHWLEAEWHTPSLIVGR